MRRFPRRQAPARERRVPQNHGFYRRNIIAQSDRNSAPKRLPGNLHGAIPKTEQKFIDSVPSWGHRRDGMRPSAHNALAALPLSIRANLADPGAYHGAMAVRKKEPVARFVPPGPSDKPSSIGKALGLNNLETASLMKAAHRGLTWPAIQRFLDYTGFSQQDIAHYLGISERTLARRREVGIFGNRESEQLLRLAEIYEAALDLFDEDATSTLAWLTSPVRGLGNARPIDIARSEFGAREVLDMIGRLRDGVFT